MRPVSLALLLCAVSLSAGDLTYTTQEVLNDPDRVVNFQIADMDGDGKPDIITQHTSGAIKIHHATKPVQTAPPKQPLLHEGFEPGLARRFGKIKPQKTKGVVGSALTFTRDGGVYESMGELEHDFSRKDFTIALWVRFGADRKLEDADTILTIGQEDYSALVLGRTPNSRGGRLFFTASFEGDTWDVNLKSPKTLKPGAWVHVAVVRKSMDIRLYLNGQEIASDLAGAKLNLGTPQLRLGNFFNSKAKRGFSGAIDEVRIYSEALAPAELNDLRN